MTFLVGMDEAGYGPNLGPLVIAATSWRIDCFSAAPTVCMKRLEQLDLYDLFDDIITREPTDDGRLAIADSKTLYKSGGTLERLERPVLAALDAAGNLPETWRELIEVLSADPRGAFDTTPWYENFNPPLPVNTTAEDLATGTRRLRGEQGEALVADVRARAIDAEEFNALIDRYGNKASALTAVSLELLGHVLENQSSGHAFIVCDKHGGRNRYGPALQRQFPEHLVEVRSESRGESRYTFGPADARIDVRFRKGGEAFLPTALASMTAKYVRELAMLAFNAYWNHEVPGLRPTAGYPVDAKRFLQEIAARQRELEIDNRVLWRER